MKKVSFDLKPLLFAIVLISIGIIALFSAADGTHHNWPFRQMLNVLVGSVAFIIVIKSDIRTWRNYSYFLYLGGVLLLLLVELFGFIGMGAQRWINLGIIKLQPSELMKIMLLLALARYYADISYEETKRLSFLLFPLALIAIPMMLVMRQPDLGTAVLYLASGVSLMFVAGVPLWVFIMGASGVAGSIPLIWKMLHNYQRERVLTFLNPERDPLGEGYHVMQSKIALGSGGVFGKGYMKGSQTHLNFLPEKQTDFVFTMIGEEFGFVGVLSILIVFLLFLVFCYYISFRARNKFNRLLAVSLTNLIFLYVFVNVAMVTGLLPVVGVPLPFISYGGTSMLSMFIILGLILLVDLAQKKRSG